MKQNDTLPKKTIEYFKGGCRIKTKVIKRPKTDIERVLEWAKSEGHIP